MILSQLEKMDHVEIRAQLNRLQVQNQRNDLFQMKLQLEKVLLEEGLKIEQENVISIVRIREINIMLNEKAKGYNCMLTGCRFIGENHRQYVRHVKRSHPRIGNIICKFRHSCMRNFGVIDDWLKHIKDDHSAVPTPGSITNRAPLAAVDIPCKCNLVTCGSKQFSKVKDYVKHFNNDHHSEARPCPYENCNKIFVANVTSRFHINSQHTLKGHVHLKPVHLINSSRVVTLQAVAPVSSEAEVNVGENQPHSESYDMFGLDEIENAETYCDDEETNEDFFIEYYADFLNRLVNKKFLPHSTVQSISEEYFKSSQKSQDIREMKLRESLARVAALDEVKINQVVADVIENDFFMKAQGKLDTQYKRVKYVHDNMQYVAPLEILLNKEGVENGERPDVIHYIPMQESLKALMEDKTLLKMMDKESRRRNGQSNKISDILDGELVKSNEYFKVNKEAYSIILYRKIPCQIAVES